MDIIEVATAIQSKIKTLEVGRELLKERARTKAETMAEYEKEIAKVLIGLKNGKEYELDGEKIQNPPASIAERIAKGICYQEKLDMELAEAEYKNSIVGMQAIQAELNGFQSLNRYLEHMVEEG